MRDLSVGKMVFYTWMQLAKTLGDDMTLAFVKIKQKWSNLKVKPINLLDPSIKNH